MKPRFAIIGFLGISATCALITGCLFKPATVTTRRFVLTPVEGESRAATSRQLVVGIGRVTMPDYLLKDSMAVRKGDNEIQYLENALWAERLDHSFQRTLAANLSVQLPAVQVRVSSWQPGEVALAIRINVERLEVDFEGRGTLTVRWHIEGSDSGKVVKDGESNFTKTGSSPYADPANIASTLSELTGEFSQILAQALKDATPTTVPH